MEEEGEEAPSEDCGGVWLVAGVDEGGVNDGSSCVCRPPGIAHARRLRKIQTSNRFDILQVWEKDDAKEMNSVEEVNEVNEAGRAEGVNGMVGITVDSGAARSVWPKKKRGVKRRDIRGQKPKLAAANGTNIEVQGEALLEFDLRGRKCGMKFLDADVRKPLVAVSAMEDEGKTVVFST